MKNLSETTEIGGKLSFEETSNTVTKKLYNNILGFSYPLKANPTRGFFSKASNVEAVKASLYQLLRTNPGERVMLPEFGCSLNNLLFSPLDQDLVEEIKNRIVRSISRYLPSLKILKLKVSNNNVYSGEGLPTLKVSLWCSIRTDVQSTFEVSVEV